MGREREGGARGSMREAARRRAEEQSHGGGGMSINLPEGVSFFKNDGKTVEFDFIPYAITSAANADVRAGRRHVGDLIDACTYKMHRDIGTEQKPYVCPTSIGKPCPICEAHAEAKKKGVLGKDEIDALRARERVLYNIIDANDKEGKVMIWDVSYHLFTKQLEHEQREREEYYDYADPDAGFTLRIRFEKKSIGRGEPFWEADRIDFEKRKALSDADLKAAVDIDAALQILDYKKLEAVFLGTDGEPEPEPVQSAGRERSAPAAAAESPRSRDRGAAPAAAPVETGRSTRGRGSEDTIHKNDPDAQAAGGKHAVDPDQDCPGKGIFGKDEGTLDHCDKCPEDTWKACRDEKDRLAREAKAAKPAAAEQGRAAGRRR